MKRPTRRLHRRTICWRRFPRISHAGGAADGDYCISNVTARWVLPRVRRRKTIWRTTRTWRWKRRSYHHRYALLLRHCLPVFVYRYPFLLLRLSAVPCGAHARPLPRLTIPGITLTATSLPGDIEKNKKKEE